MNTIPCPSLRLLMLPVLALYLSACATSGTAKPDAKAPEKVAVVTNATGKVSLEQGPESLANVARAMGAQQSGGIVVMHGLGFETMPALSWSHRNFDDAAHELAGHAGCALSNGPGYAFLHPMGYEVLNSWDTGLSLPTGVGDVPLSIAFGNGTKMSSAMAFLSQVSGVTVLVDNAVADARTGEIWLPTLPLSTVLAAVLKSARITPDSVAIETADRLVFFRSRANRSTPVLLGERNDSLTQRVSVHLPKPTASDGPFPFYFNAIPLGELLPNLSRQLGIPVSAASDCAVLPVEQCLWVNQPREMVLKYLIAQWPAPGIGYRWDGNGVVIERAGPDVPAPATTSSTP